MALAVGRITVQRMTKEYWGRFDWAEAINNV